MSGSSISWAMCKSAPRSRQITTPAPHHSVFTGRMPFLPPNQQRQSTEGIDRQTDIWIFATRPKSNFERSTETLFITRPNENDSLAPKQSYANRPNTEQELYTANTYTHSRDYRLFFPYNIWWRTNSTGTRLAFSHVLWPHRNARTLAYYCLPRSQFAIILLSDGH